MPVPFRYRKVGYVALNVTDIARTTEFATHTFALENTGTGPSGEQFLSCGAEHHDVVLYQSKEPGLVRGAWELESPGDVERAHAHYEGLGLKPVWLAQEEKDVLGLGVWPAFRVREPTDGLCFEYYSKMMIHARARPASPTNFRHIGHFGINVPNVREATEYAVANMGVLISDVLGNYLGTLLRAFPNPNHHSFAYLPARDGEATQPHRVHGRVDRRHRQTLQPYRGAWREASLRHRPPSDVRAAFFCTSLIRIDGLGVHLRDGAVSGSRRSRTAIHVGGAGGL